MYKYVKASESSYTNALSSTWQRVQQEDGQWWYRIYDSGYRANIHEEYPGHWYGELLDDEDLVRATRSQYGQVPQAIMDKFDSIVDFQGYLSQEGL